MYVFWLLVGVFVSASSGISCPECSVDCGEVGFFACDPCVCNPSCKSLTCTPPRECIMISAPCRSEPCPMMPRCENLAKTCSSSLLRATDNSVVRCGDGEAKCPKGHTCTQATGQRMSVCCSDRENDGIDLESPVDGKVEFPASWPPIVNPPIFPVTEDHMTVTDCQDCPFDLCEIVTCRDYPKATCVTDDCTCTSWFIDENEERVDCEKNKRPIFPNIFPPPDNVTPIAAVSESPNTVTSHPGGNNASPALMKQIVIASCVVFAFILVLFITYKIIRMKKATLFRKHQQEDQLKPLKSPTNMKPEVA